MALTELPLQSFDTEAVERNNALCRSQLLWQVDAREGFSGFSVEGFSPDARAPSDGWLIEFIYQDSPWEIVVSSEALSLLLGRILGGIDVEDLPSELIAAACDIWIEEIAQFYTFAGELTIPHIDRYTSQWGTSSPMRASLVIGEKNFDLYCKTDSSALVGLMGSFGQNSVTKASFELNMSVGVANATLSIQELTQLSVGDIVLCNQAHDELGQCVVHLQHQPIWVGSVDKNKVKIEYPWEDQMNNESPELTDACALTGDEIAEASDKASIGEVMVNISFELPAERLSVAELELLSAGHIFALPEHAHRKVSVVVNGATLGTGELVKIENRIGVKIDKWGSNGR